jgi:hypothetical protein
MFISFCLAPSSRRIETLGLFRGRKLRRRCGGNHAGPLDVRSNPMVGFKPPPCPPIERQVYNAGRFSSRAGGRAKLL